MADDDHEFAALMDRVLGQGPDAQAAAREVVERYGDAILCVVRHKLHRRLRSKFDSQDFVQSVWASFFAAPPEQLRFERPEELAAFLMRLARNKVVDAVRQRLQTRRYNLNRECSLDGSQAPQAGNVPGHDPTPSQAAMAQEEWQRQPSRQRHVVTELHCGRTPEEIARELNVSVRTVYRVLERMKPGGD